MKKIIVLITAFYMILMATNIYANSGNKVVIYGEVAQFRRSPSIVNDRLMVPAGKLIELLNGNTTWNAKSQKLIIEKNNRKLQFTIGSKYVMKNEKTREKTVTAPYLDKGMVMIPIRYVAEELGEKIAWSAKTKTVAIGDNVKLPSRGKTDTDYVVVIDPGHGGKEVGAVYGGLYEKDINLQISKSLEKMLREEGIKVYMTREDDSYVDLYDRSALADSVNADLLVSIHNNAGNKKDRGSMTLYYPYGSVNSGRLDQKMLAQIIQNHLVKDLRMNNLGIIKRPNLAVLRTSNVPAVLAEVAYMTNYTELGWLKDQNYLERAASAVKNGVLEALSKI